MSDESKPEGFWAIVELMGHVRMAGWVTEEVHWGATVGRVDIPAPDGTRTTCFFGGGGIYRVTPTTEQIATHIAHSSRPEPVHAWEMPALEHRRGQVEADFDDE